MLCEAMNEVKIQIPDNVLILVIVEYALWAVLESQFLSNQSES